MSDSMQAVRFSEFGEPKEVVTCQSIPRPTASGKDVLVRMLASPINPSDLLHIRGAHDHRPELPATPGLEGVGVVESGGGLRGRLFRGKRVAVLSAAGGNWAEYVTLPETSVIPISAELTDEQAAAFFVNPATAWVMTQEVLRIPAGKWLIQTAAASSLGKMIVRLGKQQGFRTLNIVRREEQAEQLRSMGASTVLVCDGDRDSAESLREQVHQATEGESVHYAVDPVGGPTGAAVLGCLCRPSHMLAYGTLSDQPVSISPRTLMRAGTRYEGFSLGPFMQKKGVVFKLRLVRRLTKLVQSGVFETQVGATFKLEQIVEAIIEAERTGREGKVLLRIGAK